MEKENMYSKTKDEPILIKESIYSRQEDKTYYHVSYNGDEIRDISVSDLVILKNLITKVIK